MLNETVMSITLACHSPLPPLMPIHAHTCCTCMSITYVIIMEVGEVIMLDHVSKAKTWISNSAIYRESCKVIHLPYCPATPLPRACVHYSRTYVARTGVHVHDLHTLLYALSTLCYVIRRGINVPETSAAVEEINTCTVKPLECIT